jgi:hypothetical protein
MTGAQQTLTSPLLLLCPPEEPEATTMRPERRRAIKTSAPERPGVPQARRARGQPSGRRPRRRLRQSKKAQRAPALEEQIK